MIPEGDALLRDPFFLVDFFSDQIVLYFRSDKIDLQKNNPVKKIFIAYLILLIATSCTHKERFSIEGKVPDNAFNGSKIYLVALDGPVSKKVDSTIIGDGNFHFETIADSLCAKIIRVPPRYPSVIEDLVVVTEPGVLHAVMSSNSYGEGTRLNNTLQLWKQKKLAFDSLQHILYARVHSEGLNQEISDSLKNYSKKLNDTFMAEVVRLQNENVNNGIGLFLFKLYYHAFPPGLKNRILKLKGSTYANKDAELKRMIGSDYNVEK